MRINGSEDRISVGTNDPNQSVKAMQIDTGVLGIGMTVKRLVKF